MTPPPETPSDPIPTPGPAKQGDNGAPPVNKPNGKKKKKKGSNKNINASAVVPPADTAPAANEIPTPTDTNTDTAPPPASDPAAAPAPAETTSEAAPSAATGEEEGGLFGGWTTGLTEGMNQLWGSVSGEGEHGANNNSNSAVARSGEGEQNAAAGGNTGEGADGENNTPLRSPALIPLSKAAAELENAGKAAQIRLGKAAQEVERGWGAFNNFLDEFLSPPIASDGRGGAAGVVNNNSGGMGSAQKEALENANEKLHERFPALDAAEEAVEVYECSLVQKYKSALNDATPEKTVAFAGVLYITPAHIAMYVVGDNFDNSNSYRPFGIVVPLADVKRVQKGSKAMLRIVTADKNSYVFASFASEDAFKATVELLHHLVGADDTKGTTAQATPPQEQPAEEKTA